jgi:DNA-binding transcriptional regulator GbsR (MarR family)
MNSNAARVRDRFVEAAGHFTQSLGIGRTLGQIFVFCYFSPRPQSLDDLAEALKISKGGASMAVRQLEQWGALRRVWIRGDRKVYYEASTLLGQVVRRMLAELVGRQMELADQLLEEAEKLLRTSATDGSKEDQFVRTRLQRFRLFRDKTRAVWNSGLVRRLLQ